MQYNPIQAIIWTKVDIVYSHIYAYLDLNES